MACLNVMYFTYKLFSLLEPVFPANSGRNVRNNKHSSQINVLQYMNETVNQDSTISIFYYFDMAKQLRTLVIYASYHTVAVFRQKRSRPTC